MKRLPTENELLSWYLFWRQDEVSLVESPAVIRGWIEEFWLNPNKAYIGLYEGYKEFRRYFVQPVEIQPTKLPVLARSKKK